MPWNAWKLQEERAEDEKEEPEASEEVVKGMLSSTTLHTVALKRASSKR